MGFYHRDGTPLREGETFTDLVAAMYQSDTSNPDHFRVAYFEDDGVRVSTVFLGIDHSFGGGEPIIFETMIFGGAHDQECIRYSTEAEAHAGHVLVVAGLRLEAEHAEPTHPERVEHENDD